MSSVGVMRFPLVPQSFGVPIGDGRCIHLGDVWSHMRWLMYPLGNAGSPIELEVQEMCMSLG